MEDKIRELFGKDTVIESSRPVSGGDINEARMLKLNGGRTVFMKKNAAAMASAFEAEALGLAAIRNTKAIRTPEVLGWGTDNRKGYSFLLLEYIEGSRRIGDYWETFAAELAHMHMADPVSFDEGLRLERQYGFVLDNYIGMTPQVNTPMSTWIGFFRERRLAPQFEWAEKWFDAADRKRIRVLLDHLEDWLVEPDRPSLIHGDLWAGNVITGNDGKAWLIDPAVYYGHPEADIAMTELFGGFPPTFYHVYSEITGLDPGYEDRRDLYNLYQLLNHLNMFGGGYYSAVQRIIRHYAG